MRRIIDLLHVVLLAFLLSGCDHKQAVVRMAMLCAPFCYLIALIPLSVLRTLWLWRVPSTLLRPRILAIPWVLLFAAAGVGLGAAHSEGENVVLGALLLSSIIFPVVGFALCVPLLIVWRIWFAIAPQNSFEGAACWATLVFFAPGIGVMLGVVSTDGQFMTTLAELCLYFAGVGVPLALVLALEAILTKIKASKSG